MHKNELILWTLSPFPDSRGSNQGPPVFLYMTQATLPYLLGSCDEIIFSRLIFYQQLWLQQDIGGSSFASRPSVVKTNLIGVVPFHFDDPLWWEFRWGKLDDVTLTNGSADDALAELELD